MIPRDGMATARARVGEIEVRAADGKLLRGRWWRRPAPRGVIIVSHGFGEHGGGYQHVAETLGARLELDVIAVDYRGHGRSPGRRGVVGRYHELTEDLLKVLDWAAHHVPDLDRFVLGHSNGGQVALHVALREQGLFGGLVVSNPALRVAVPVSPRKLMMARLLARCAPWITLSGEIRADLLTRDPDVREEHRADPLRHGRISAPLYFGMIEGGEMLLANAGEIRTPILMLLGGQDPVIDPAASREFFDRLASVDKTLLIYPKMLHEPFNELGREQVVDDTVRWLEPRL
ncbi:MAG: alpha/beta hydrolase [Isosphaerales bacterium]